MIGVCYSTCLSARHLSPYSYFYSLLEMSTILCTFSHCPQQLGTHTRKGRGEWRGVCYSSCLSTPAPSPYPYPYRPLETPVPSLFVTSSDSIQRTHEAWKREGKGVCCSTGLSIHPHLPILTLIDLWRHLYLLSSSLAQTQHTHETWKKEGPGVSYSTCLSAPAPSPDPYPYKSLERPVAYLLSSSLA